MRRQISAGRGLCACGLALQHWLAGREREGGAEGEAAGALPSGMGLALGRLF